MLGTRGVRLGHPVPGAVRDAGPRAVRGRGAGARQRSVEVMVPLVAYERELELMRGLIERVGRPSTRSTRLSRSAR